MIAHFTMTIACCYPVSVKTSGNELPCWFADPELFFAESPVDIQCAKTVCQACPVRSECLAGALQRREPWGVWGGELFSNGTVIPTKRARGRPRKEPIAA
jgi:WhiB family redox-sensing transcriptional regulator